MKYLAKLLMAFCFLVPACDVAAGEIPATWPWHGFSIQNTVAFDPLALGGIVAEFKINSIQIRLLPRLVAERQNKTPAVAWQESLAWGDQMLDECKRLGLVAIMTVEGGFPLNPAIPVAHESAAFWSDANQRNEVTQTMDLLSAHYANRGAELAAYQILSEPLMWDATGKGVEPPQWRGMMNDVIATIRKNDPSRWIAVAPPPGGGPNVYVGFKPFNASRIIYGAHMYIPLTFTHQGILNWQGVSNKYPGQFNKKCWDKEALKAAMMPLRDFQLKYGVPVWIGEFSAISWAKGGDQYLRDLVEAFNAWNWSWTYFTWNGYFGWQPDYDNSMPVPMQTWPSHRIGALSPRWQTLKQLFLM